MQGNPVARCLGLCRCVEREVVSVGLSFLCRRGYAGSKRDEDEPSGCDVDRVKVVEKAECVF